MRRYIIMLTLAVMVAAGVATEAKRPSDATTYSWTTLPPLGLHVPVRLDTLITNYSLRFVPTSVSPAYVTTGNYGAPGETLLFMDRQPASQFFFADGLRAYLPQTTDQRFYNSRIPMTILDYSAGGGRENEQSRFRGTFSGNFSPRAQIGANFDYLYSRGSYDYQALKHLTWGVSGSYMGERYEFQGFFNHWNQLEKENGGITNDLYITDPAEIQGGQTTIQPKVIPTNLVGAFNRVKGGDLYLNNVYKLGFWREEEINDSTTRRYYVPVTRLVWTLNYKDGSHRFYDTKSADTDFWTNTYFNLKSSDETTSYWSLNNTVGLELMEEFNKFAHFGLSAFLIHEVRQFKLPTLERSETETGSTTGSSSNDSEKTLTALPNGGILPVNGHENVLYVGGQLTKQKGSVLTYDATVKFGLLGVVVGDLDLNANLSTNFKVFGDSMVIRAYGRFSNSEVPYLLKNYVSNHFIWHNDFGKERRLKFGGHVALNRFGTRIDAGVENVQNLVYFNENCMPTQAGGSVQVVSATLGQDFRFGPMVWANRVTWQATSDEAVIPLPKLVIYSNLSVNFKVARVLGVQAGLDCSYYTKYQAVDYQPATMVFYNQRGIKCGNYPIVNAFVNMRLSRVRFFVMMSHVNQGLTGTNYFSMPHYPINPRRFQMGLCVDFQN